MHKQIRLRIARLECCHDLAMLLRHDADEPRVALQRAAEFLRLEKSLGRKWCTKMIIGRESYLGECFSQQCHIWLHTQMHCCLV